MMGLVGAALAALLTSWQPPLAQTTAPAAEVIAEIRVHGNHVTTDEQLLSMTGLVVGAPFTPTTIAEVTARLKAAKRFDDVTVLKRYASIADPSQIAVVVIVNEGPVKLDIPSGPGGGPIRVVKRNPLTNVMFMPILDGEDGYGLTYGVRLAYVGVAGRAARLSFPLQWGGLRRAGAEFERTFASGPLSRIEIGTAIQRQHNPGFDANDDRSRLWFKAERAMGPVRVTGTGGIQHVAFLDDEDDLTTVGAGVTYDTRLNPVLPRNAVYASAVWEHVSFSSGGGTERLRLDGRGYVGLVGQSIFVVRAVREDANEPLPRYLKSLLGGWSNLRGFEAGSFNGDTLVAGSAELRMPISSPLSFAKLGVSVFVDAGSTYDKGQRLRDQDPHVGMGAGVWMTAAVFKLGVSVAHGLNAGTRVNFGTGLSF